MFQIAGGTDAQHLTKVMIPRKLSSTLNNQKNAKLHPKPGDCQKKSLVDPFQKGCFSDTTIAFLVLPQSAVWLLHQCLMGLQQFVIDRGKIVKLIMSNNEERRTY